MFLSLSIMERLLHMGARWKHYHTLCIVMKDDCEKSYARHSKRKSSIPGSGRYNRSTPPGVQTKDLFVAACSGRLLLEARRFTTKPVTTATRTECSMSSAARPTQMSSTFSPSDILVALSIRSFM
mmetsp:Transcript_94848/g.192876  ORF Transcript_94848/g.192876 Transcript_94848/m.192876 type:complete len:125 (+) Transcript_94848:55-429(+)